ncbi:NAD(P)/FAD-dependent oxidoreductase [Azospirillum picis]|uniref:D-amino-acid dehydrogenase n=1 Tax=Azospirillum picis TaxID=488438 RepID=A0ABU0MMK4_9PROT|nr:FAD-dependent oxidoreductase [Azospirillum picis]MBP2300730.1 D-amino-acid dehydrogenase [Azospirillum picis]MDQ0534699.1 D-amino-acid dehydrogenase [Azospirillum picis]
MRIAVVGAGIIGVALAHALLDEGHEVDLYDREGPAAGASAGNAGWIAHMDILPLASPKAWAHMPRWVVDPLGPLSISPRHLPRLAPWLLRFVAASRPDRIAAGSRAIHALNALSLPAWERRLDGLGLSHHLRRTGILSVWTDRSAFAAADGLLRRQSELGIAVERLDAAGVRALEPVFASRAATGATTGTGGLAGGALYPTGAHVGDPRALTEALADAARGRGLRLTTATVTALEPGEGGIGLRLSGGGLATADRAVIACGAWAKRLAASVGDHVPLDTERGYNITVARGTLGLTRPVMYEGHGFVTTPLDSGDRIGGSVEFAGLDAPPNWARVDAMLGRLARVLPGLAVGEGTRWMGFRPSIPDSLPVIGPAVREPRIIHAFGHGHYGLTQAAATADLVAAMLAGRAPAIDAAPYAVTRFGRR